MLRPLLLLLFSSSSLLAQHRLVIAPTEPAPGAVVMVTLHGGAPFDSVTGTMAGEPLHFVPAGDTAWGSLGAIPIDASKSVSARALVWRDGRPDTLVASAAVPEVKVAASSRLSVAPRFSQPMDSATSARIARENAKARAVGRRSHGTPQLWRAPFAHPRQAVLTSQFGTGRVFNGVVTSRHLGVDFRGAVGAEVRATNRGVVALVDTFYLAGKLIYLDHGLGVVTSYFHLSETLVAEGDTVQRGQLIGRVGESGRVTGPHLHWAARYGALPVNPLDLIRLTAPPRSRTPSAPKPSP